MRRAGRFSRLDGRQRLCYASGQSMNTFSRMVLLWLLVAQALPAADDLLITEFMALNKAAFADEDGTFPDWVEIYNNGINPVNLGGWFLTDNASKLTKWQFPATNLPPNNFLVVFCDGKNRRAPGAPLHTSFSLDADGEYLALVRADGHTIASQFSPTFPQQYADVSYGFAMTNTTVTLLATGAAARVFVPSNDLGTGWLAPGFNDAAWLAGATAVGFDTGTNYTSAIRTDLRTRMLGSNASAFVRVPFVVSNVAAIKDLTLRMRYDDGFVAWLNGALVASNNAPASLAWNSTATADHGLGVAGTLTENFEGAGTNYTLTQYSASPNATVQAADTNSTGKFLRLITDGVNSDLNGLAFNQTAPGLFDHITADFDFRILDADGNPADGFSFLLIPTSLYGTNGPGVNVSSFAAEEPSLPGIFAVGFDVYPRSEPRNDVSVHWNGAEMQNITMPDASLNLTAGVFHHAKVTLQFVPGGARATVTFMPNINGTPGAAYTPISSFFIAGLNPYDCRVQFAGRTGGLNMSVDLDNIAVQFVPPTGLMIAEEFSLAGSLNALVAGTNVLALQGLNRSAANGKFLLEPELVGRNIRVLTDVARYFSPATPGLANDTPLAGKASPPVFTPAAGVFASNTLTVTLAGGSSSATIRYTLDGSQPGASSPPYTAPITLTNNAVIRARAYESGKLDGDVAAANYVLLSDDVTNFTSNLPLIIIDTLGVEVPNDTKTPAYALFIDTNTPTGRVSLAQPNDFLGRIGIELHGQSALQFPKKAYNVELRDESDSDLKYPLLGLPKESDWGLYACYTDKTFINNVLSYELHKSMGHYSVRRKYVEVFLRSTAGRLSASDYIGVYVLLEKIRVSPNRVDLAKLGAGDLAEPDISGGYIFKKDKDSPGDVNFTTSSGEVLKYHDPKGADLATAQQTWLVNYINQFEAALYGSNWRDPVNGYARYIDVDSFVDFHWIVEYPKNIDGVRLSNYFSKDRGGKIQEGPIWDWDLTWGNADYLECALTNGWYYPQMGDYDDIWLRKLRTDPDFSQKITDRWADLRGTVFHPSNLLARVDQITNLLWEAQARDFARWPRLGTYIWPNPSGPANGFDVDYVNPTTYAGIIEQFKMYIAGRYAWIDSQFTPAPALSHAGGAILPGFVLNITAAAGTIYYTLDGTDPRQSGDGVSASAHAYSGPLTLTTNAGVFARALNGTSWSAPARGVFVVATPSLAITEIMYHPVAPPTNSPYEAEEFEFLEVQNTGSTALDLTGVTLGGGINFTFPAGPLVSVGTLTTNSFDGGTSFTVSTLSAPPAATTSSGGPSGNFLRLLSSTSSTSRNRLAFQQTASGSGRVVADFDFRAATSAPPATNGPPTTQTFDTNGTAYTVANYGPTAVALMAADSGSTGSFLRLVPASGGEVGVVAFDRTAAGAFNTITATFDFRMTPPDEGNQADGLGFALLSTASYGTNGAGPAFGEEPNLVGSLGVGFDIYNNASTSQEPNNNHLSLHWNGAQIGNAATPSFDLSNGRFHRALVTFRFASGNAYVTVRLTPNINGTPGTTETVFQDYLITGAAAYEGRVAFAGRTGGAVAAHDIDNVNVQFLSTGTAAGLSLVLLPVAQFGASGAGSTLANFKDSPALANAFALDLSFDPSNTVNDAALFWNGAVAGVVSVPPALLDFDNGQFHHARLQLDAATGGTYATLALTSNSLGTAGAPITVFSNLFVPGMMLGDSRVELAGRSGSLATQLDVDNVGASFQVFSPNWLQAGEYVLVVKNRAAFESRYGTGRRIAGEYSGQLNNAGDHLTLSGAVGEPIMDFNYKDGWHPLTDGLGFSLVLTNAAIPDDASGWRVSTALGGSPGQADDAAPAAIAPILVNEALTHSLFPAVDAIELFNPTANAVNLGGWFLSDDFFTPEKFRLPANTFIPAHGFLVFTENDFNAAGAGFALNASGDDVWLFSGDAASNLTGYAHGFSFGAAEEGVSFGRVVLSMGDEDFVAQRTNTLGGTNAGPRVGPVVVAEIMFHPPDSGTNENFLAEFIELQNITATNVLLFDPNVPTNTWHLRNAVDFDFPTNLTLPAGARLLVVGFDPAHDPASLAAFRAAYPISTNSALLGPWAGHLDNAGETIELKKPGVPTAGGVPYVMVEAVHYRASAPWPVGADGEGASLQRIAVMAYGNEPTNWCASVPTPGVVNESNLAPTVLLTSPAHGAIFTAPTNLTLTATASDRDDTIALVEFFADGVKVGQAAGAPFACVWTNPPAGLHVLVAEAHDTRLGAALSGNVLITVRPAPPAVAITSPANNAGFLAGTTVTLGATASSSGGAITKIEFFTGAMKLGEAFASPASVAWPAVAAGVYPLLAVATDDSGTRGTSAVVNVAFTLAITNNLTLVATGALWKYFDKGQDLGTNWTLPGYDDSSWSNGLAELGYGDAGEGRPEATVVSYGPDAGNKYPTTYFRRRFVVTNAATFTALNASLLRDDGAVVWLNGVEVWRSNMTTNGPITYSTYALSAISAPEEATYFPNALNPTLLVEGTNLVAVEIHQGNASSSDISFDLGLAGAQTLQAPAMVTPPASQTVALGSPALLSATAVGTPPLAWQWRCNGAIIPGATQAALTFPSAQPTNTGLYSVTVTNAVGAAASPDAFLLVQGPLYATQTVSLIPVHQIWRYNQSGVALAANWRAPLFDDSAWPAGPALLGFENSVPFPYFTPMSTALTPPAQGGPLTVYFRTHFNFTGAGAVAGLVSSNWVDDGAVYYLNGAEVGRLRLAAGAVDFTTLADNVNPEGQTNVLAFPADSLFQGDNVLAVEVHQTSAGSSDVVFGMTLDANRAVLQRPALLSPRVLGPGTIQLNLASVPGWLCAIDASTNLVNWTELRVLTNVTGQVLFQDAGSSNAPARFYRSRLLPWP